MSHIAVTILKPRDEVERRWGELRPQHAAKGEVSFCDAPGDRGTELHVRLPSSDPRAKDDLRHFKALLETGEVPRSDGSPEGERVERKFKQRPAQPLEEANA